LLRVIPEAGWWQSCDLGVRNKMRTGPLAKALVFAVNIVALPSFQRLSVAGLNFLSVWAL
jgi:hypothetical protein